MTDLLVREIQRRNPFQIECVPWIARVYRQPVDRWWSSLARQALFGAPNFLLFWLYKKIMPGTPKGSFRFSVGGQTRTITFDARNTQFSALYFKAYCGGYEAHIAALIDLLIPDEGTFLDIGSNWGWFSLFVASKPSFRGEIHAFEPFPATFKDLETTVSQAGLSQRIKCHNIALSDRAGNISMYLPDKFQSGQAIMTEAQDSNPGGMRSRTLDSLQLPQVSVIKMDVEGSEAKVIRGAAETLSRLKPMIIFENGRSFSDVGKTLDPLFLLENLDYQFFHIAWVRPHGDKKFLLGDDDDSLPQDRETMALVPFAPEERFLRANGMNVFACHKHNLGFLESLFRRQSLKAKRAGAAQVQ